MQSADTFVFINDNESSRISGTCMEICSVCHGGKELGMEWLAVKPSKSYEIHFKKKFSWMPVCILTCL